MINHRAALFPWIQFIVRYLVLSMTWYDMLISSQYRLTWQPCHDRFALFCWCHSKPSLASMRPSSSRSTQSHKVPGVAIFKDLAQHQSSRLDRCSWWWWNPIMLSMCGSVAPVWASRLALYSKFWPPYLGGKPRACRFWHGIPWDCLLAGRSKQ